MGHRGFPELREPEGSRDTHQEPSAQATAAEEAWRGLGAMVAKPLIYTDEEIFNVSLFQSSMREPSMCHINLLDCVLDC